MTLRSGAITLPVDGTAKNIATILGLDVSQVPVYAVDIQADAANSGAVYVGASDVTADTGIAIPIPQLNTPVGPYRVGDFGTRVLELDDVFVRGTAGDKVHVLVFA